jgi:hypothetical protein
MFEVSLITSSLIVGEYQGKSVLLFFYQFCKFIQKTKCNFYGQLFCI